MSDDEYEPEDFDNEDVETIGTAADDSDDDAGSTTEDAPRDTEPVMQLDDFDEGDDSGDDAGDDIDITNADDAPPIEGIELPEDEVDADVAPVVIANAKAGKIDAAPILQQSTKIIIIPPSEHRTSNIIQETERASLIAVRAQQIDATGQAFIPIGNLTDSVAIAIAEYNAGRCPLKIRRLVGYRNGMPEYEDHEPPRLNFT